MADHKTVAELIERLRHQDQEVRELAAWHLGKLGPAGAEAVPALIITLMDDHWRVRNGAASALSIIGQSAPVAVPKLKDALRDQSTPVREWAARVLGEKIHPAAAEFIKVLSAQSKGFVREAAMEAYRAIGCVS